MKMCSCPTYIYAKLNIAVFYNKSIHISIYRILFILMLGLCFFVLNYFALQSAFTYIHTYMYMCYIYFCFVSGFMQQQQKKNEMRRCELNAAQWNVHCNADRSSTKASSHYSLRIYRNVYKYKHIY